MLLDEWPEVAGVFWPPSSWGAVIASTVRERLYYQPCAWVQARIRSASVPARIRISRAAHLDRSNDMMATFMRPKRRELAGTPALVPAPFLVGKVSCSAAMPPGPGETASPV